jgi:hypothetical protein
VLTALATLLAAAPVATAAPTWLAPQPVSAGLVSGSAAPLALAADGSMTMLWTRQTPAGPVVVAAERAPGGTFGDPVPLSSETEIDAASLVLSVAPSGTAVAAWLERATGGSWRVAASARTGKGSWEPPQKLSADGADAADVGVGISDAGDATAVWQRGGRITVRRHTADGDWAAEEGLSATGVASTSPRLAVSPDDHADAIWLAGSTLAGAHRAPGGVWLGEAPTATGTITRPAIAAGPGGRAAAVWTSAQPGMEPHAEGSARTGDGPWEPAFDLGPHSPYGDPSRVTVDGSGTVTTAQIPANFGNVSTATEALGGSWSVDPDIDPIVSDAYLGALAGGRGGDVVMSFMVRNPPDLTTPALLYGAVRARGTAAWRLQVLDATHFPSAGGPVPDPFPLTAGVDEEGNAVVTWPGADGTINVGLYDAAGPDVLATAIPSTAVTGATQAFAVTARDRGSSVASTTWDFGDGRTASGAQVTHAYAAPGDYTVTAVSRDAPGNTTSITRAVHVVAPTVTSTTTPGQTAGAAGQPAGTPGTPTGKPGVQAEGGASPASAATIRALLRRALKAPRRQSGISALLSTRRHTYLVRTVGAGRLVITWSLSGRNGRQVLVATGTRRFSAAVDVRLAVRLTAAGRRRLAHARSVRLTARATYIPSAGTAVTVSRAFTITR